MNTILDASYLPKLSQDNINHLNRSTTSNETETVINSLPIKKAQDWTDSLPNSTKPLKKN
jgi:hypothetical protein